MYKDNIIITSESVSDGHPDKICDQIADAILDEYLIKDCNSKVACEVLIHDDNVIITGEIDSKIKIKESEIINITRETIKKIGYDRFKIGNENFSFDIANINIDIGNQSYEIKNCVNKDLIDNIGAGDQGVMYGYACNDNSSFMPMPIFLSNRIMYKLSCLRKSYKEYNFLRPDGKSQVSVKYLNQEPKFIIESIVVAQQHDDTFNSKKMEEFIKFILINDELINRFLTDKTKYFINTSGSFKIGGPKSDTGLTGRKIIADTYGCSCLHGGGSFSGKDPSKVDRSSAYMCRHIAKSVVASKLAEKCEIYLCYTIGNKNPLYFHVNTFGTYKFGNDCDIKLYLLDKFDLELNKIIEYLNLKKIINQNWCYKDTAAYGHFGRDIFPWESVKQL